MIPKRPALYAPGGRLRLQHAAGGGGRQRRGERGGHQRGAGARGPGAAVQVQRAGALLQGHFC